LKRRDRAGHRAGLAQAARERHLREVQRGGAALFA
jgi:hypothetical protein